MILFMLKDCVIIVKNEPRKLHIQPQIINSEALPWVNSAITKP
ncbi:hypothetical protein HHA03_09950 [Halolactibacillus halophilus]|uniref:Uncharacterized protein n=1 Tax=Halolactibacillus halophilus TaxID=306540 RepID=A0ABQ0VK41_9BACI|nr:hypothetical protein HHA03_09950 [Halolactibacillus halophilus]